MNLPNQNESSEILFFFLLVREKKTRINTFELNRFDQIDYGANKGERFNEIPQNHYKNKYAINTRKQTKHETVGISGKTL